jgi:uncharacterized protein (TIGR03083 family)
MASELDYLDHLRRESARFVDALQDTPSETRVPSCPDWDADDLIWHLAGVQWFWGQVVARRVTDGADAEKLDPGERPAGREALLGFYHQASADLSRYLAETDPATTVWTWSAEQSAGFIRRRQAHEALVHRLDAELTAGNRTPMDPALAADGVDEALRVMYGGCPPWGTITPVPGRTVRLAATDTGDSWLVTLARFTGTDPDGKSYDEPDIAIAAADRGDDAAATVSGSAEDLDCWLWRRPTAGDVGRAGDLTVVETFETTVGGGIQ